LTTDGTTDHRSSVITIEIAEDELAKAQRYLDKRPRSGLCSFTIAASSFSRRFNSAERSSVSMSIWTRFS
jgi:hypothetical protein